MTVISIAIEIKLQQIHKKKIRIDPPVPLKSKYNFLSGISNMLKGAAWILAQDL